MQQRWKNKPRGRFSTRLKWQIRTSPRLSKKFAPLPNATDFDKLFGENSLDEAERAYGYAASAIAAFERSAQFRPFSSKYDLYLAGEVELSMQ